MAASLSHELPRSVPAGTFERAGEPHPALGHFEQQYPAGRIGHLPRHAQALPRPLPVFFGGELRRRFQPVPRTHSRVLAERIWPPIGSIRWQGRGRISSTEAPTAQTAPTQEGQGQGWDRSPDALTRANVLGALCAGKN